MRAFACAHAAAIVLLVLLLLQGAAIHARKPQWETGAKAAIALKPRAPPSAAAPSKAWVVSADDKDEDGAELLDDEALLTEEDMLRPAPGGGLHLLSAE